MSAVFILGGLLLEALALSSWSRFWLHPVACALFAVGFGLRLREPPRQRGWGALALVLTLTVPGISFLGLLALTLVNRRLTPPTPLEEMQAFTLPEKPPPAPAWLTRARRQRQALQHPGTLGGDSTRDLGAVRAMLEPGRPTSTPALVENLRGFLLNPHSDASLLARSELGKLRQQYTVSIIEASERIKSNPDSIEAHLSLALLYEELLRSGLLEETVLPHYLDLAVARWGELARLDPSNPSWPLAQARLMMSHGQARPALEVAETLLERWPDDPDVKVLLLEVHYEGARHGALEATRSFLAMLARLRTELEPSQVRDPRLREMAGFWLEGRA